MALIKVPVVMMLSFQTVLVFGETFLAAEPSKDNNLLKVPEKRTNNFRVPMEMPYDTNFWPARGRRSRRDPEKVPPESDNCLTSEGFLPGGGIRCQGKPFELLPEIYLEEESAAAGEWTEPKGNCRGYYPPRSRRRHEMKFPDGNPTNPRWMDDFRFKKHRQFGQPPLVLYGNGVYWEPDSQYGEKKKKEDVFWVARGKKNFDFNYPQN